MRGRSKWGWGRPNALRTSAAGDGINLPTDFYNNVANGIGQVSMSIWVRPGANATPIQRIVDFVNTSSNGLLFAIEFVDSVPQYYGFRFGVRSQNSDAIQNIYSRYNNTPTYNGEATVGVWKHIYCQADFGAATMRIVVQDPLTPGWGEDLGGGKTFGSSTYVAGSATGNDALLRRSAGSTSDAFFGSAADLVLWSRLLTDEQIAALQRGAHPLSVEDSDVLEYFPLDHNARPFGRIRNTRGLVTGTVSTVAGPPALKLPANVERIPLTQPAITAFPVGWKQRVPIAIDPSKVPANLTGFPVLITKDMLPSDIFDADGYQPAQNGGGDIRITTNPDGTGRLPLDVVSFVTNNDPANGQCAIHTKVPTVQSAAWTRLYVWYGHDVPQNQPAVDDTYGRNAVWSDYLGVWHLADAASGNQTDATGKGYIGVPDVTQSTGTNPWGGQSLVFGTGDKITVTDDAGLYTTKPWVSVWFKQTTMAGSHQRLVNKAKDTPFTKQWQVFIGDSNWNGDAGGDTFAHQPVFQAKDIADGTTNLFLFDSNHGTETPNGDSVWHQVHATYDRVDARLYFDGANNVNGRAAATNQVNNASVDLTIGAQADDILGFQGEMTEVRYREIGTESATDLANWITAEYNNQSSPATFAYEGRPVFVNNTGFGDILQAFSANQPSGSASYDQASGFVPPKAGSLLVFASMTSASANVAPTDNGTGSWTEAVGAPNATDSDDIGIYWKIAAGDETQITWAQTANGSFTLFEIDGGSLGWKSSPVDKTASTTETNTTSKSTGTTAATAQANEVAIGLVMNRATANSITGWTNAFIERAQVAGANGHLGTVSKVLSATGAQETTATFTVSGNSWGAIATFMENLSIAITSVGGDDQFDVDEANVLIAGTGFGT